jgi:hypothetical protein
MNQDFYNKIAKSNASTNCRNNLKKMVLNDSDLLVDLIQITTDLSYKNHFKGVWITEMIAETDIALLTPFTQDLIPFFSQCKHQSAVRGTSRIAYFLGTSDKITLTESEEEKIIETCLDWLIGDAKVAPKVYAMYTLCHFAQKHDWIKDELQNIIEKDFAAQSAGYKAAAKETLRKISRCFL